MNINDIDIPAVTISDVWDTPRISGAMDDKEVAMRARIRAHIIREGDPFVVSLPGEDVPF